MALDIDPQLLGELARLRGDDADAPPPPVGDVATRRANSRRTFDLLFASRRPVEGVDVEHHSLTTTDGATMDLAWYRRANCPQPGSAALYLHGGGMILGLSDVGPLYDSAVPSYVAASGVPMLVVDYRIAPEFPHPAPVTDCYAALVWLTEHAEELNVDAGRLAVMGDSAGGGLAAGVALMARDCGGPAIAQQVLIYPMLDDRTAKPDPQLLPFATWTYDDNATGWDALLGLSAGGDDVSPYAAPARATDLSGLPPTYIDLGDLDIFRDEDLAFARRLAAAAIPTELHLHPGCPHAFDLLAPNASVSQRVVADRVRRLQSL